MNNERNELDEILIKFSMSGWKLIEIPAISWLNGCKDRDSLLTSIKQADLECGSCGCEYDPLYKKAIELLDHLE